MNNQCRLDDTQSLIDKFLLNTFEKCKDDLVSMQTIKYRMLAHLLKSVDITFGHMCQLFTTHTPVHPDVAEEIKKLCVKQENYQIILAQDFIENEKLTKLMRHLSKAGHTNIVHTLLAIDGMAGSKLNHGPNTDVKRYVENLKYSLSGEEGVYDCEKKDKLKRAHVNAVRSMYNVLDDESKHGNNIYYILCCVLKECAGIEILGVEDPTHNLDVEKIEMCVNLYKESMPAQQLNEMITYLKNKLITTGTSDEEEENPTPKRKRVKYTKKNKEFA